MTPRDDADALLKQWNGAGPRAYRPRVDFRVLGPVAAFVDGKPVGLGGPKQRTVLALLLLDAGRAVPADVLIDGVWGDEPTPAAKSTLQSYVFNLRSAVGDRLVTERGGYRLAVDRDDVDAYRFEDSAVHAGRLLDESPVEAAELLRAALALWEGRPYNDVSPSLRLETEARRLDELRRKALEDRVEAELALGRHADLVPELEVLTAEFPLSERFRAQQMLALYRCGRQSEALRAYQKTRRYLADELGLDPSPPLQQLEARILVQDQALDLATEAEVLTAAVLMTGLDDAALLWELHAESMVSVLRRHDELIGNAVEAAGGRVFSTTGDGTSAAFDTVGAAAAAAEAAQRALTAECWDLTSRLRVRIAVDAGEVELRDGDYFGPPINRCARLLAAAHGGQILLSDDAHDALSAAGGAGWQVKALGEHRIRGLARSQPVFQLVPAGIDGEFPPLRTDRVPSALPSLARTVRGFELRERAGGGRFGVVYRAYQPSVGREAAVKVIRPEYVNDPEFVRRFEAEAQVVAQLEHPHIVPLYDFWRDPGGAYLVTRWMRGGSLRAALDRGPLDTGHAVAVLHQVGGALSHAHRHGVVHRDLKPSNVLMDDDGNAYAADFGIAVRIARGADRGPLPTSPSYLAPEERCGGPVSERTDIYSLGLVAFELFSGHKVPIDGTLPPLDTLRPELPAEIDTAIRRAVANNPADRFESVVELLAAVDEAIDRSADGAQAVERIAARNPYKGLHAFQEADSSDFFGRTAIVDELVEALAEHRLIAVVGPSGIGKSSIVRAGLVPRLRSVPDGWLVTDMIPGAFPFDELAAALMRVAVQQPEQLADDLASGATTLVDAAAQITPGRVLLVIDQFEELFTLTAEDDVRTRFIANLTGAATDPRSTVAVLVTLRADFLDRPLRYPELGELLSARDRDGGRARARRAGRGDRLPGGERRGAFRARPRRTDRRRRRRPAGRSPAAAVRAHRDVRAARRPTF